MAAMLRSRAYVAHHGYQRQLRFCTPTRHVAHAGFAEGAAATGAPNTQPEAAEEVAQLRTKLAAAEAKLAQATAQAKLAQATSLKTKLRTLFKEGASWLLVAACFCVLMRAFFMKDPIMAGALLLPIVRFTDVISEVISLALTAMRAKLRDE